MKPDKTQEKTEGGLYLPEEAKKKPNTGTVVEVGEGTYLDNGTLVPCACKVGDHILFERYVGVKMELNGEEYLVMDDGDSLGRFE